MGETKPPRVISFSVLFILRQCLEYVKQNAYHQDKSYYPRDFYPQISRVVDVPFGFWRIYDVKVFQIRHKNEPYGEGGNDDKNCSDGSDFYREIISDFANLFGHFGFFTSMNKQIKLKFIKD